MLWSITLCYHSSSSSSCCCSSIVVVVIYVVLLNPTIEITIKKYLVFIFIWQKKSLLYIN